NKSKPNGYMRFNTDGIGFSRDGGKTYRSAMTYEGIVADAITAGTLRGILIEGVEIRGGLLQSLNNDNTFWDLNTGLMKMNNADFMLGGGANIEFTDRNNRLFYTSNNVYAGIQFDRSKNDATNPLVAIGVSDEKHNVNDPTFRGIRIHSLGTEGRTGQGTNIVTEEFTLNSKADLTGSGFRFRMHAKNGRRGIAPLYSESYNYDLGTGSNYWSRAYIYEIRVNEGDLDVRNQHADNQGWRMTTSYQGESQMALFGMNAHNYFYDLGKTNRRFSYVYLRYQPDVSSDERLKTGIKEIDNAYE